MGTSAHRVDAFMRWPGVLSFICIFLDKHAVTCEHLKKEALGSIHVGHLRPKEIADAAKHHYLKTERLLRDMLEEAKDKDKAKAMHR